MVNSLTPHSTLHTQHSTLSSCVQPTEPTRLTDTHTRQINFVKTTLGSVVVEDVVGIICFCSGSGCGLCWGGLDIVLNLILISVVVLVGSAFELGFLN
jgi:hypothetical protein